MRGGIEIIDHPRRLAMQQDDMVVQQNRYANIRRRSLPPYQHPSTRVGYDDDRHAAVFEVRFAAEVPDIFFAIERAIGAFEGIRYLQFRERFVRHRVTPEVVKPDMIIRGVDDARLLSALGNKLRWVFTSWEVHVVLPFDGFLEYFLYNCDFQRWLCDGDAYILVRFLINLGDTILNIINGSSRIYFRTLQPKSAARLLPGQLHENK